MERREYNRLWNQRNRTRVRAYRELTKDRRNAARREKYHSDAEHRRKLIAKSVAQKRKRPLRAKASYYGVDERRLEVLLDRGCMICGAGWAPGVGVRMHVDHDHATDKFRGVLCENCNHGIGKFQDNPLLLEAAIQYLTGAAV